MSWGLGRLGIRARSWDLNTFNLVIRLTIWLIEQGEGGDSNQT